jgi:UDP-3-O-[3-hydroxymyristoyl] N-acetylglucosamine deacetylase
MKQRTIKKSVSMVGIGLHKGVPVRLTLEPMQENSGIIFYRSDKKVMIPAKPQNVVDTKMATVIAKDGAMISTIEHLLSAIGASGIDNLKIIVDNDEIPIMDGSSIPFCMLLDEAGIMEQNATKRFIKITDTIRVEDGEKFVQLKPSNGITYNYTINFPHKAIGSQTYSFEFGKYKDEIARARTFGFLKEVQYLRSIGLALGGSLDNAIVLDDEKILNRDGLRFRDEFVRHKILDAIGDMVLLGSTFIGEYSSFAGSHHLNHLLTKKVLENSYQVVENYERSFCLI